MGSATFLAGTRLGGLLALAAALAGLVAVRDVVNAATVAVVLLLVVLLLALRGDRVTAFAGATVAMLGFNVFFLQPYGTLRVHHPADWVALAVFYAVAVIGATLSTRLRERAEQAEAGRAQVRQLYSELQAAFERDSQTEALRRSEQLKSALLDAVTHDLRTPLTSIKAAVTSLLDQAERVMADEDRRELLQVVDEETDRLNHFVENLVQLARIEAQALDLRRTFVSVEELVNQARHRLGRRLDGHSLVLRLPADLPLVRGDAPSLGEVLYSLLDNATRHAPAGTPITVTAEPGDAADVVIAVDDEGPGIPPALRTAVFQKFFKAPQAGGRSGLGMGLAIAHGLVQAHGGRIWVEDGRTGRGARMVVSLPIGDVDGD